MNQDLRNEQDADDGSGTLNYRPELDKALQDCQRTGARLVIAKIDRRSRNVLFIAQLLEGDVPFVCCDLPDATPFILQVMAAVGEQEAKAISDRTKAALAAYKARGGKLGGAREQAAKITTDAAKRGREISRIVRLKRRENADEPFYEILLTHRISGMSFAQIASRLNDSGYHTRTGKNWNAVQVRRILLRASHQDSKSPTQPTAPKNMSRPRLRRA